MMVEFVFYEELRIPKMSHYHFWQNAFSGFVISGVICPCCFTIFGYFSDITYLSSFFSSIMYFQRI